MIFFFPPAPHTQSEEAAAAANENFQKQEQAEDAERSRALKRPFDMLKDERDQTRGSLVAQLGDLRSRIK